MTTADIIGLALSFVFVFAAIGAAGLIHKYRIFSPFTTRKIIHISVAHWWIMAMLLFTRLWTAAIGPVFFIIFNYVSLRLHLVKAMEDERESSNWGTVLFPLSLLGMVVLCWSGWMPLWIGAAGILVLGWGDGLASLAGRRWGLRKIKILGGKKSWAGTGTLVLAAFVVALVVLTIFSTAAWWLLILAAAATALLAAVVELATPFNLDNISVPFSVALFLQLLHSGGLI